MRSRILKYSVAVLLFILLLAGSILLPEWMTAYQDRRVFQSVQRDEIDEGETILTTGDGRTGGA